MYTLKTPSFLRPSSRPSSPVPLPGQTIPPPSGDRVPRTMSKLSLTNFRRASPSPAVALPPSTVVQDGSYLEVLGLKLSEAVSKALAHPTGPAAPNELLAGRRPVPAGRGRALGALIASEINASHHNPHLYRAIIRTLHRPLSVLLTNLSSNLLPLISSPAFLAPPSITPNAPYPTPTQLHALALATCAGELLETFDELKLGLDADARGDNLKTIRDGLVSIVKRVIEPLMTGVKNELMPYVEALEKNTPASTGATSKSASGTKSPVAHPSIMTLQAIMPSYARILSRYVTCTMAENTLASILISLVWHGLVALSHRRSPLSSPPASPTPGAPSLFNKSKDSKRSGSAVTPPATPPFFGIKLPPSRPPSPSGQPSTRGASAGSDARALFGLLNLLPRPTPDKESTRIAREAVEEAFDALSALTALLEAVQAHTLAIRGRSGPAVAAAMADLEADLEALTNDLPTLVALPVLLRACASPVFQDRSVSSMLGLTEDEYRKGCLGGFGRAEECAEAVGQRVLDVLRAEAGGDAYTARTEVLVRWLERQVQEEAETQH